MKICFFGVGGVGGYFGALVTNRFKHEHEIFFIARGAHFESIRANGLTLKMNGGSKVINVVPGSCTSSVQNMPVCDIIILSVKEYDLANAVKEIKKITNEKTIILPLLNGVDIYERIREHLHNGIVLPSCVYIGTHIESPGVINQNGGEGKIFTGSDPRFPDYYPELLLNLMKESSARIEWMGNKINTSIWAKFIFIAAFGLVTATYDKTLGEILGDAELSRETKAIMDEIDSIARQLMIPLPSDIVQSSFEIAKQFPFETKTSFQRDVESKGEIHEGDLFGGTILRYGEELNIPTPVTSSVYAKLAGRFK